MAVSGSTDFKLTASQLIEASRRKAGIQAAEEPMQDHELQEGLAELNMMIDDWQTDGVYAWTYTEGTLALVQGAASYLFGAGGAFTTIPLDMIDIRITRSVGNDLPMSEMSREEYFALPNKTSQGFPTQWFYDRQRSGGTLYVWPCPDATAATLGFTYKRLIMDVDIGADDFDFPREWYNAIMYNLTDRLAENYGRDLPKITQKAAIAYIKIKEFDTAEGKGSISIVPEGYGRR